MDNDAKALRCYALASSVCDLARNEKRDPERVSNVLQIMQDDPNWEQQFIAPVALDTAKIREELILWQQFDQKFFPDVHVGNYTNLRMPNPVLGFNWPIVNARGVTASVFVARMKKEFQISDIDSIYDRRVRLDAARSDREPISSSYIVLVRDCVEADEKLKGKNADMIAEAAIPTITLSERLRLEAFYWWKTGKHLDVDTITDCWGSRSQDGNVPRVYWRKGHLHVYWYYANDPNYPYSSRVVIS